MTRLPGGKTEFMTDRTYKLGHEPIGRLLARLSIPGMVAMSVHSTYNLVDAVFVVPSDWKPKKRFRTFPDDLFAY